MRAAAAAAALLLLLYSAKACSHTQILPPYTFILSTHTPDNSHSHIIRCYTRTHMCARDVRDQSHTATYTNKAHARSMRISRNAKLDTCARVAEERRGRTQQYSILLSSYTHTHFSYTHWPRRFPSHTIRKHTYSNVTRRAIPCTIRLYIRMSAARALAVWWLGMLGKSLVCAPPPSPAVALIHVSVLLHAPQRSRDRALTNNQPNTPSHTNHLKRARARYDAKLLRRPNIRPTNQPTSHTLRTHNRSTRHNIHRHRHTQTPDAMRLVGFSFVCSPELFGCLRIMYMYTPDIYTYTHTNTRTHSTHPISGYNSRDG